MSLSINIFFFIELRIEHTNNFRERANSESKKSNSKYLPDETNYSFYFKKLLINIDKIQSLCGVISPKPTVAIV
jgi:hypothetical protein